jgi:hypothetical protein
VRLKSGLIVIPDLLGVLRLCVLGPRGGHSARLFSTFQNWWQRKSRRPAPSVRGGIASSKISGGEAIEASQLPKRAVLYFFRAMFSQPVRGSSSRRKAA